MSVLSKPYFHDEEAAFGYLESVIWQDGPVCPHCGGVDRITKVKANPEKRVRFGLHRCGQCKAQFTVKIGTVFEHMRLPLHKALQAVYLMTSSKKGISAHQLHRVLEITYKSAWFLCQRIRETWLAKSGGNDGDMGPIVEVDETFIGGKEINKHASKKLRQGRGTVGKAVVVGIKDRSGMVRAAHVSGTDKATLHGYIAANVRVGSTVMTDEHAAYRGLDGFTHHTVRHSAGEYVNNMAHTNGIESFWALLKRGYYGIYHYMSAKHLDRYIGEFSNRQNTLNLTTLEFLGDTAKRMVGRHISYKALIHA